MKPLRYMLPVILFIPGVSSGTEEFFAVVRSTEDEWTAEQYNCSTEIISITDFPVELAEVAEDAWYYPWKVYFDQDGRYVIRVVGTGEILLHTEPGGTSLFPSGAGRIRRFEWSDCENWGFHTSENSQYALVYIKHGADDYSHLMMDMRTMEVESLPWNTDDRLYPLNDGTIAAEMSSRFFPDEMLGFHNAGISTGLVITTYDMETGLDDSVYFPDVVYYAVSRDREIAVITTVTIGGFVKEGYDSSLNRIWRQPIRDYEQPVLMGSDYFVTRVGTDLGCFSMTTGELLWRESSYDYTWMDDRHLAISSDDDYIALKCSGWLDSLSSTSFNSFFLIRNKPGTHCIPVIDYVGEYEEWGVLFIKDVSNTGHMLLQYYPWDTEPFWFRYILTDSTGAPIWMSEAFYNGVYHAPIFLSPDGLRIVYSTERHVLSVMTLDPVI